MKKARLGVLGDYLGMLGALAVLLVVFGVSAPHFFTGATFRTIANQCPYAVALAVGMTYILIIREIDLSVGSVLALSHAVFGVCLVDYRWPLPLAALACVGTGMLCGLLNGLITIKWSLPSFITTLGMLEMARGATYLVTGSRTKYLGDAVEGVGEASLLGLRVSFLAAAALVVAAQLVLTRTVWGRYMTAIGTNEEAVRLSGIDPRPVKIAVFVLCGALAALAAVDVSSQLGSVDPNLGIGFELGAIAAVVIGGTSLMGGRGSVLNSFFGVLIIAVLGFGLVQVGAKEPTKRLITGAVIVAAVILDHYRTRLGKAST